MSLINQSGARSATVARQRHVQLMAWSAAMIFGALVVIAVGMSPMFAR